MLLSLSPSGTILAHTDGPATSASTTIALRDATTGRWRNTLSGGDARRSGCRQIAFASGDDVNLVVWRWDGSVTVWDVSRSVLTCTIVSPDGNAHHEQLNVCAMAMDPVQSTVVLAVTKKNHHKIVLHEYAVATGKLLRKIKGAGKFVNSEEEETAEQAQAGVVQLAVTAQHFVVRSGPQESIRILERETGSKVSKISSSALEERAIDQAFLIVEGDLGCVLDLRRSNSQVLLFRVSTGKILKPISSQAVLPRSEDDGLDDYPQLVKDEDNNGSDCFWLRRGKTLAYIQIQEDHKHYSFRPLTLECATPSYDNNNSLQQPQEGCVGFQLQRSEPRRLLAMQVGLTSHNDCRIQTVFLPVPLDDNSVTTTIPISFSALESKRSSTTDTTATSASKKRGANTAVLGPGQVGGEARGTTDGTTMAASGSNKRNKLDQGEVEYMDDDNDDDAPTLAERLRQLQEAMDQDEDDDDDDNKNNSYNDGNDNNDASERFVPQQATTESLTQLLQQALQSNDTAMLEMALEVRDPVILMESCHQLELAHLSRLLLALTARLSTKPARAEHLCRWIKAVLQQCGGTQALEEEGVVEHMQALQNLVQERLEVFPMLLQLEGRLARMVGEP